MTLQWGQIDVKRDSPLEDLKHIIQYEEKVVNVKTV